MRGRPGGIERHRLLQRLDGLAPTRATAQRNAELQEGVDVGLVFLQRHDAAGEKRLRLGTGTADQVSARVVSPLIHSRYFSIPASTGRASNSGTLYGCSSANAARSESSRADRVLSITTTSRSSATLPCQR